MSVFKKWFGKGPAQTPGATVPTPPPTQLHPAPPAVESETIAPPAEPQHEPPSPVGTDAAVFQLDAEMLSLLGQAVAEPVPSPAPQPVQQPAPLPEPEPEPEPPIDESGQWQGMQASQEDVVAAYKLMLGRLPENMAVVDQRVGRPSQALMAEFLFSPEFRNESSRQQLILALARQIINERAQAEKPPETQQGSA